MSITHGCTDISFLFDKEKCHEQESDLTTVASLIDSNLDDTEIPKAFMDFRNTVCMSIVILTLSIYVT